MLLPIPSLAGDPVGFRAEEVRFGDGVSNTAPGVLERLGVESVLVVTDEGVEAAGITDAVTGPLESTSRYYAATEPAVGDFTDVPVDGFDGILAIGGGSVLDTAKVVSVLARYGGTPADYLGVDEVPGPVVPVVAVPTTSGTGSQATQTAVISHEGVKRGISDEYLRPAVAVVDPLLTTGLPRDVTAASGFDAFVHALESLTARDYRWVPDRPILYQGANPVSRPVSWRALRLVHAGLERAVYDGTDLEARRSMSLGSHLAGLAFSNAGLGIVHALASAVGGMTEAPHGACLASAIRPGLSYNLPVRTGEYAWIARAVGLTGDDVSDRSAAEALIAECERVAAAVGLPTSFAEVGLDAGAAETIVANTLIQERRLATTPRVPEEGVGLKDRVASGF